MDEDEEFVEYPTENEEKTALAFAENHINDEIVQKSLMNWNIVKCKNCGQKMSLLDADYDELFAPIHKNCGGKRWTS